MPSSPPSTDRAIWGRRLRALLPWLLGAAILVWLLLRVPLAAVAAALAGGRWGALTAYVAFELALLLVIDSWATVVTLRQCGGSPPHRDVLAMRGATYLLNLVHFGAGQGAFGWYLARAGRGGWNAGGALLLMLATQGLALVLVVAAGLLLAPPWLARPALPIAALALAGIVAYLVVISMRPGWAQRVALLRPLLVAGLRGHLVAGAARVPHMAVLVLLNWGLYRVWGMPVPLRFGLAVWPILMLVSALPITPSGLGTVQAMQVSLFAEWAPGADLASRQAGVLALTIASYALALLIQAVIGAFSLRALRRGLGAPPLDVPS
ncbi:MAG TPA: lysylphosphatidylglycerol synthase domain-containing protein [Thermoanaerobaculia bacterium]|nr:lysylphosphatidylglycerol synthase domain-containing protein [Thermoanaerobaculia bacterium]